MKFWEIIKKTILLMLVPVIFASACTTSPSQTSAYRKFSLLSIKPTATIPATITPDVNLPGDPPVATLFDPPGSSDFSNIYDGCYNIHLHPLHGRPVTIAFHKDLNLDPAQEKVWDDFITSRWLEYWEIFQGFPYPEYTAVLDIAEVNGNAGGTGFDIDWNLWRDDCQAIGHEIFHAWNGNAFYPAGLEEKWFQEGFTQYYGYRGCGSEKLESFLRDDYQFYAKEVAEGRDMALFSAGPQLFGTNQNYFYYFKGALVADLLDRALIDIYNLTLDDYMRSIYRKYGIHGMPITTANLLQVLNDLTGRDMSAFFDDYIYGLEPLPDLWK